MSCWKIINKKRLKKENKIEVENDKSSSSCLEDYELRILVIGPPNVGKTAICTQFVHHYFPQKDIGNQVIDVYSNHAEYIDGETSLLRIIKVSMSYPVNMDQNQTMKVKANILECEGYVVIYSVTDRCSWETSHQIINHIYQLRKRTDIPLILVGNKTDQHLERCVGRREAQIKAFHLNISFCEVSTKNEQANVINTFHDVVRQIRCVRMRIDLMTKEGLLSPNTRRKTADCAKELLVKLNVKPSIQKDFLSGSSSTSTSPRHSLFRKKLQIS